MALKFITGNKDKFKEVSGMLHPIEIEQLDIDLTEIQSLDPHEIIRHKLQEALKHEAGEFIVEDTSMYLDCLNGQLPGPYIKWFLKVLGPQGIANIALSMGQTGAKSMVVIGYAKNANDIKFFEGVNEGTIVSPVGENDFGWGPIFKPKGWDKTYGEMQRKEKYEISMRALATKKLKEFLLNK